MTTETTPADARQEATETRAAMDAKAEEVRPLFEAWKAKWPEAAGELAILMRAYKAGAGLKRLGRMLT